MRSLKFGSLFAGIGGLDLGLERAGMQCAWQVEIDDYATKVLARHWPAVHRERDVRTCGAHNLAAVDLICGGFPCQDISYAGAGLGLAGARSGLWREFKRIIGELRPRYVLVENVAALLKRGMGTVLGDLSTLGYDAEWSIVSACAMGAPHSRERMFIVAYPNGTRRQRRRQRKGSHSISFKDTAQVRASWAVEVERLVQIAQQGNTDQRDIRGGTDGLPSKLVQLRGLGNAVVPQVAEFIGRMIVEFDTAP